jgi:hypothetical protein
MREAPSEPCSERANFETNSGTREFDTTKGIDNGIGLGIHPRVPGRIPLVRKTWPLDSTSIFPYIRWVGADKAWERVDVARAKKARFM